MVPGASKALPGALLNSVGSVASSLSCAADMAEDVLDYQAKSRHQVRETLSLIRYRDCAE